MFFNVSHPFNERVLPMRHAAQGTLLAPAQERPWSAALCDALTLDFAEHLSSGAIRQGG